MDPDDILAKQVEQLEKEKRELQEKLKAQEKKVDFSYYLFLFYLGPLPLARCLTSCIISNVLTIFHIKRFFGQIYYPENYLHDIFPPEHDTSFSLRLQHSAVCPSAYLRTKWYSWFINCALRNYSDDCSVIVVVFLVVNSAI